MVIKALSASSIPKNSFCASSILFDNPNGASFNLSSKTFNMRPDKRTSALPLH